jgi:quercetin dioxygenase-like cupin family protein
VSEHPDNPPISPPDSPLEEAALYALGALDPDEAHRLELRLMQGDVALGAQIGSFAPVVGQIGQALPPVAPGPAIRTRLLDNVHAASRPSIVRADEGTWEPTRAGTVAKGLMRDPIGRRVTALVRMRPGSVYPSHRHQETEELYILGGTLDAHEFHLGPGDYCAALGGSVHRSASTERGCEFLVSASVDDDFLRTPEPSSRGLLFVPDREGAWGPREAGVTTRRVAIDPAFGVATVLVRMEAGSRGAIRGQQIYVLTGEARLADGELLRAGDFCGTPAGTAEVTESPTGCLLLVLAARGAIAREGAK